MYCVLCLMSRLSIQEIKALDTSMVQMLCYVDTVDTHVSAHNFLNIQQIFNPKKVLECWEPGLSNHTTKSYICRYCRSMSKQSIHCVQNKLHSMVHMSKQSIHMFLPITFLIFNGFSIRKKFWNAENQGFPTIPPNPIYVEAVEACRSSRYIVYKINYIQWYTCRSSRYTCFCP